MDVGVIDTYEYRMDGDDIHPGTVDIYNLGQHSATHKSALPFSSYFVNTASAIEGTV
jgi:hypothetical protein